MSRKATVANLEPVERRKHWRDRRRAEADRRNPARMRLLSDDCRSGRPRRTSDVTGDISDGDIWWNKDVTQYE
ncbi:MAG TPA: hypothetical protein ENJ87_12045 [Gammaproteobacteria bacterium]|nr:hypothetical protein [Gammaproteobacteria bacterium]